MIGSPAAHSDPSSAAIDPSEDRSSTDLALERPQCLLPAREARWGPRPGSLEQAGEQLSPAREHQREPVSSAVSMAPLMLCSSCPGLPELRIGPGHAECRNPARLPANSQPDSSPRQSTCCKPAKSKDKKGSVSKTSACSVFLSYHSGPHRGDPRRPPLCRPERRTGRRI